VLSIAHAHDFLFHGSTRKGMERELEYMYDQSQAPRHGTKSTSSVFLGFLRASVYLAGSLEPFDCKSDAEKKLMGAETCDRTQGTHSCLPSPTLLLQAMFPHLEKLVEGEFRVVRELGKDDSLETSEATDVMPLDEGGSVEFTGEALSCPTQYFCGICEKELANAYVRCKGCEQHASLSSAFHVCLDCFLQKSEKQQEFWREHVRHVQIRGRQGYDCPSETCLCKDLLSSTEESAECLACKVEKAPTKKKEAPCIMSCKNLCHEQYEIRFRFLTKERFLALEKSFCRVRDEK
jgi:hypothetical protein